MAERRPTLVLLAHGTHDPAGQAALEGLRDAVAARCEAATVTLAHLGPGPAPALSVLGAVGPAVLVPALLSEGHHVAVDLAALAEGRPDLVVTPALGPDPRVVEALADRVRTTPGDDAPDAVVLVAAGSGRPRARAQVRLAAQALGRVLGARSGPAYLSGPGPDLAEALDVARGKVRGGQVVLVSYLLAPGHFQSRLLDAAAEHRVACTAPLADHPRIADLVAERYHDALAG